MTVKPWKWVEEYRDLITKFVIPEVGDYMIAILKNGTKVAIRD